MSKKKILITIISLFFIIGLLLNIPIKNSQAITQNLNYTFDNDYIFNNNSLVYETFNIRNQTTITQNNYTGSYDFLNELGLTSTDIIFVDTDNSGIKANVSINESSFSHNNILNLTPHSTGSNAHIKNNIDSIVDGTIEFWVLNTDATYRTNFFGYDGGTIGFQIRIDHEEFAYYDGSEHSFANAYDNIWYHISIYFNCVSSLDYFTITINGIQYGAYDFRNLVSSLTTFEFNSDDDNDYSAYIDAIGYDWLPNYTIGQNIELPQSTITDIQEIDKCEFAYNITTLEPNDIASHVIDNNWIENDDGNDWIVQTNGLGNGISIDLGSTQLQDYYGIYKEFSYNAENIFNITFNITSMALYSPFQDGWYFNIYSYDDTLLVSLLFNLTAAPDIYLSYYNGSDYIEIHEIQDLFFAFDLNIYIYDRVILSLNDDGVNYNWIFAELTSKIGINIIEIISGDNDDIGDNANIDIDSIGLYINGSSYLPDDLSSIIIETDIENWDDSIYNIFGITGNGSFSFSVYYNYGFQDTILPYSTFNSETKIVNYIDGNIFDGSQPYTFVGISNISFNISQIYVYSIILKENSNTYYPTIEYNNIDSEVNFFYVMNNRLYFYVDLNNYSYEGIKATFNIPEVSTINGTISFVNYYEGHLAPYLCLNYTYAITDYFQFKNYPNTIKHILPQNKYLYQLIINVSDYIPFSDDNYTNHNTGFISGYIQNIKLGYIPDIGLTITTIDLITVIIPIMFIFIPSLMAYYGFGKEAVIPVIILMSIIALISEVIQAWIFFIIAYSIFIQLISQRKRLI